MEIRRAGVVGLGLLGRGITACLLAQGLDVVVFDREPRARDEIGPYLDGVMREIVEHRPTCTEAGTHWRDHFTCVDDLMDFAECDLVVESVSEVLDAKRELLQIMEGIVREHVPLASNTSALPITELQRGLTHPERVLGTHWAEPAFATRFLELIGGAETSSAVLERVESFARTLGKEPCVVSDVPGFLVNRLGYAMYREALHLMEIGVADAATIDRAYRNAAGLWASFCGPFRWIDITGGPALYARAMEGVLPKLAKGSEIPPALQEQIESDRDAITANGTDARTGFYGETQEQKQAWLELLHRQAWEIEALRSRMDEAMRETLSSK